MRLLSNKLKFMGKYGTDEHRAMVSNHVDDLLHDAANGHPKLFGEIGGDVGLPLNKSQVHKIIDSPKYDGMTHPMVNMVRWRHESGEIHDEHFDKIVRTARGTDLSQMMAHLPSEHAAYIANDPKRDPFVRQLARNKVMYNMDREARGE